MRLAILTALFILPRWLREEYAIEFSGDAYELREQGTSFARRAEFSWRVILSAIKIRAYYIGKPRRAVLQSPYSTHNTVPVHKFTQRELNPPRRDVGMWIFRGAAIGSIFVMGILFYRQFNSSEIQYRFQAYQSQPLEGNWEGVSENARVSLTLQAIGDGEYSASLNPAFSDSSLNCDGRFSVLTGNDTIQAGSFNATLVQEMTDTTTEEPETCYADEIILQQESDNVLYFEITVRGDKANTAPKTYALKLQKQN